MEDDAKSNPHTLLCTQFNFDGAELVPMPTDPSATLSNTTKHLFRDLEGKGKLSWVTWVRKDENNDSPIYQHPGEAPQHKKVGYMPRMDEESSLDQSKVTCNTLWKAEADKDKEVAGIHTAHHRKQTRQMRTNRV